MLDFIRSNAQSLGVKLIFGLIILVFIFWGVGSITDTSSGTVVAVNTELENAPEVMNSDPYGAGWIVRVKLSAQPEGLMDAAAYEEHCKNEQH